jgi:hypothetical protein
MGEYNRYYDISWETPHNGLADMSVVSQEILNRKDLSVLDNNDAIDVLKGSIYDARFQQTQSA